MLKAQSSKFKTSFYLFKEEFGEKLSANEIFL